MSHTLEEHFAHFLCYQNWNDLPQDEKDRLRVAYEHGNRLEKPQWVSTVDRLPEMGVLVLASFASVSEAYYELLRRTPGGLPDGKWIGTDGNIFITPRYWMPLPSEPK